MKKTWWKESVIYQIYPRSYKDSTGNGIGDIHGIISKLDYIKSLGVDMIWICPIYDSPNDDNGYDIRDYRKISEEFGGDDAFDQLITTMHNMGLKLVMDLVFNHSSDEHYWFEESRKSKDNPYRDYYHWLPPKNGEAPNNWTSLFNGSVWEFDDLTEEYYLHLFTRKQPDLNWENPKVRKEIHDIVKFWSDKGVDGFRMDVISMISKNLAFPNTKCDSFIDTINEHYANGPRIHEFLNEMNKEVLSKYDIMTVGEGPGIDLNTAPLYVKEEREELNMIFHFDHMFIDSGPGGKYDLQPFTLQKFKRVFGQWDACLENNGWGSIFLGNHDFSRMVSRFGNDREFHSESAKLLATILLTLRGTVYIYQGDEIGMTNVAYDSIEEYNDVETLNAYKQAEQDGQDMNEFFKLVHHLSRDNARSPMHWDDSKNAGFSAGDPWLKVNTNYPSINVASQENNSNSILNYYRKMIAFRKSNPVLVYGEYNCIDEDHDAIFAYKRFDDQNEFLIVHNMSDQALQWQIQDIADYDLTLSNMDNGVGLNEFQPWQSKIYKRVR